LVGQGYRPLRIRSRTPLASWPVHFWNESRSLPQPLQVRRLDTNRSLGVSAYFLLQDPQPRVAGALMAAADRLSVPYVVAAGSLRYTSGGETATGDGSAISLTDAEYARNGQVADRALAASLADRNVLYYRLADDEPDPPSTDVCFANRTLEWFRD